MPKKEIQFKWIKNRNLTPLLDIEVELEGEKKKLKEVLLNGEKIRRSEEKKAVDTTYHTAKLRIEESDWNKIKELEKNEKGVINLRYLSFKKEGDELKGDKEAKKGDIFYVQSIVYNTIWNVGKKTHWIDLASGSYKNIETAGGTKLDRVDVINKLDPKVAGSEYIFRVELLDNKSREENENDPARYKILIEKEEGKIIFTRSYAQYDADRNNKTLDQVRGEYAKERGDSTEGEQLNKLIGQIEKSVDEFKDLFKWNEGTELVNKIEDIKSRLKEHETPAEGRGLRSLTEVPPKS